MNAEEAVQKAIWDRLRGDAALGALLAPHADLGGAAVYDAVPQAEKPENAARFPYVTIGDDVVSENDTDTSLGLEFVLTIHCWSRHRGRLQVKEIQGAIYNALHRAALEIPGYAFEDIFFETSQSFPDADGVTRHGVQTFRVRIAE